MICPVCQTNNDKAAKAADTEPCMQCGSDLAVHRLLLGLREVLQRDIKKSASFQKTAFLGLKLLLPIFVFFLLLCGILGVFAGLRFVTFLDHEASRQMIISDQWAKLNDKQLQQMNILIKEELDLILEQRQENQALREKIQALSMLNQKNITEDVSHSGQQGHDEAKQ